MKKISIIIVTYNSQNLIKDCLDSIFIHNDLNNFLEVIVVDNCSSYNSKIKIKKIIDKYDKKILFIQNKQNLGYGAGNNIGIKKASANVVCIMNPDVRLIEPIFLKIIDEFKNKNISLIGLKQFGGKNLSYYFKPEYKIPLLSSIFTKVFNRFDYYNEKYMFISGAFFFLNKNAFIKCGKFDEKIFMYGEEADISNRLLRIGSHTMYIKNIGYKHLVGDRNIISFFVINKKIESLLYYLEKYKIKKQLYLYGLLIENKSKFLLFSLLRNEIKKKEINYFCKKIKLYI